MATGCCIILCLKALSCAQGRREKPICLILLLRPVLPRKNYFRFPVFRWFLTVFPSLSCGGGDVLFFSPSVIFSGCICLGGCALALLSLSILCRSLRVLGFLLFRLMRGGCRSMLGSCVFVEVRVLRRGNWVRLAVGLCFCI